MMGHREKLKTGDEYDFLTRARKWYHSDYGRSKRCKQAFNRRIRRSYRQSIEPAAGAPKENET